MGYVDARDVAQAIRLGVACLLTGAQHRQRNGRHLISATNAKLLANQFSGMPLTSEVGEHDTLLAVDKAQAMLGCAPEFSSR